MSEETYNYDENPVIDYGEEKPKRTQNQQEYDDDRHGRTVGGLVLIGLGVFFLLNSLGIIDNSFNWWAIFILMPGIGLIASIFTFYMRNGYVPSEMRGKGLGGVMILLVGLIFLFDMDWGQVWPLFLIVPGIALVVGWIGDED